MNEKLKKEIFHWMQKMDSDYQILTKLPADKVIEETAKYFYDLALEDVRKEVESMKKGVQSIKIDTDFNEG